MKAQVLFLLLALVVGLKATTVDPADNPKGIPVRDTLTKDFVDLLLTTSVLILQLLQTMRLYHQSWLLAHRM